MGVAWGYLWYPKVQRGLAEWREQGPREVGSEQDMAGCSGPQRLQGDAYVLVSGPTKFLNLQSS